MTTDDKNRERNLQFKVYGLFLRWGLDHDQAVDLIDQIATAGLTFTNSLVETQFESVDQSEPKTYPGEPNLYSAWPPGGSGGKTYYIDNEPGGFSTVSATSDAFVAKTFDDLGVIDQVQPGHSIRCKRIRHEHGLECSTQCPCHATVNINKKV